MKDDYSFATVACVQEHLKAKCQITVSAYLEAE